MNGRRLHLEYAKSKGCDAQSFVERKSDYYCEVLTYKDSSGSIQKMEYNPQEMVHWIIKACKITLK